jgi:signal transduction histidine kinase
LIIGFSQLLSHETFGPLGSKNNREYVEFINKSGTHLLELITDILDLSKVETSKITLHVDTVDINSTIADCLPMVEQNIATKNLSVSLNVENGLELFTADSVRVKQIFLNLLTNAVKFTPENGSIDISAGGDEETFTLSVADTGIGIEPESLSRVMKPFEQVDDIMTRHHDGSGLGLALVNLLTGLHGGSVSIDSALGEGTTVSLYFPRRGIDVDAESHPINGSGGIPIIHSWITKRPA